MTDTKTEALAEIAAIKAEQREADLVQIRKNLRQAKDLVEVSLTILGRVN